MQALSRFQQTKQFLCTMGLEDLRSRELLNSMDILYYRYILTHLLRGNVFLIVGVADLCRR